MYELAFLGRKIQAIELRHIHAYAERDVIFDTNKVFEVQLQFDHSLGSIHQLLIDNPVSIKVEADSCLALGEAAD
jgi:hypothetical protein